MVQVTTGPDLGINKIGPTNPILKFLDRLLLWLPNERSPGLPAVGLFLVRQVMLPMVLLIGPLIVAGLAFPNTNLTQVFSKAPAWPAALFIFLCFGSVQELGRYSFVRRADRPLRSLIIFTITTIMFVVIVYHDEHYRMGFGIAGQIVASGVLFYATRHRKYIVPILLAIIVSDVALYMIVPFKSEHDGPKGKNQTPASAPIAPAIGNMASWAKLYPGAVITKSSSDKFSDLTSWNVSYSVPASPEQIESFYESVAKDQGFAAAQNFGGLHMFRQDDTGNDFSYSVSTGSAGSDVNFQARTFGRTIQSK